MWIPPAPATITDPYQARLWSNSHIDPIAMANFFQLGPNPSIGEQKLQQKKIQQYNQNRMKYEWALVKEGLLRPSDTKLPGLDWTSKTKSVRMGGSPFAQTEAGQNMAAQAENINQLGTMLAAQMGGEFSPVKAPDTSSMDMRDLQSAQYGMNRMENKMGNAIAKVLGVPYQSKVIVDPRRQLTLQQWQDLAQGGGY